MSRSRKPLLWAGCALLLAFGALLGYAAYEEEQLRNQYKAPVVMDYGFIPVDLFEGRTHYEGQDRKGTRYRLNHGSQAEGRILMARIACGIGAAGVLLLVVRAFATKREPSPPAMLKGVPGARRGWWR